MSSEPSPSSGRRMKEQTPFYEPPSNSKVKTPAQIISEARKGLINEKIVLRKVSTRSRPETPRDGARNLFGEQSTRDSANRPPSAFSMDPSYMESESRPVSGTRLAPLDHSQRLPRGESDVDATSKPPMDPTRPPRPPSAARSRPPPPLLHQSMSVETGPTPSLMDPRMRRSGSMQNMEESVPPVVKEKRVHSGPKERSKEDKKTDSRRRRGSAVLCPDESGLTSERAVEDTLSRETNSGKKQRPDSSSGGGQQPHRTSSGGTQRSERGNSGDTQRVERGNSGDTQRSERGNSGGTQRSERGNSGDTQRRESGDRGGSGGRRRREGSAGKKEDKKGEVRKSGSAGTSKPNSGGRRRETEAEKTNNEDNSARRDEMAEEEAQYYNEHVSPILEQMTVQMKDENLPKLVSLCDALYRSLEEKRLLGKACKRRPAILKIIFKLLDLEQPRLLLKLARIILALRVSGNNLTNVCKLVFKVSKEPTNDNLFLEDNILDLLIELAQTGDVSVNGEALMYCVCVLKILSSAPVKPQQQSSPGASSSVLVKHLVHKHMVEGLAKLLMDINKRVKELGSPNDQQQQQIGDILFQLMAALRNALDVTSTRQIFLQHHIIEELGKTVTPLDLLSQYKDWKPLILYYSRILSRLSTHADCCAVVGSQTNQLQAILHILHRYPENQDIVHRVCFVLSNVTQKCDASRSLLAALPRALDVLLSTLKHYLQLEVKCESVGEKVSRQEDIIDMLVCTLANLSTDHTVGQHIATSVQCVEYLINILEIKPLSTRENMVMNVLAALNNLAFYNCHNSDIGNNSAITKKQIELADALFPLLANETPRYVLADVTRVIGNMSQEKAIRDHLHKHNVDEVVICQLDSENEELVFASCGVLVNLMMDHDKRHVFKACGGVSKCYDVLEECVVHDWWLGSMVCKILLNYSTSITSTADCFDIKPAEKLTEILGLYLDGEFVADRMAEGGDSGTEITEHWKDVWETEFCPLAEKLIERIETYSSKLEAIDPPHDS